MIRAAGGRLGPLGRFGSGVRVVGAGTRLADVTTSTTATRRVAEIHQGGFDQVMATDARPASR
jgi:hypothetical protein